MVLRSGGQWARAKKDIRNRMLSGLLVLVPFAVAVVVVRWLFLLVTGFLRPLIIRLLDRFLDALGFQALPRLYVSVMVAVLSVILLAAVIYLIGAVAQFVVGRRMIHVGETVVLKIPIVGTVYSATKQVMQALSLPEKADLKSVVLVEFPRPGHKSLAFLTGKIQDKAGNTYCKLFIPTAPNPTTGFFQIVPVQQVRQTDLSIEEAFKMILSGGLVGPEILEDRPFTA